ncbi:MAG: D-aminoacylase, partial [Planctomycetota bacterium]
MQRHRLGSYRCGALVLLALSALTSSATWTKADEPAPDSGTVRDAILKSLPLLEKGARGSMTERKQCFTCHNQGLPILAMSLARTRGFKIDQQHLHTQLTFIADFLRRNREKYLDGSGTGGRADTAG